MTLSTKIAEEFGDKIRIRACGILIADKRILLVKHKGLGENGIFWAPPGGGVQFGESISDALKREFNEETGLIINHKELIGVYEHVAPPLHAIEFYYSVATTSGTLKTGTDPEMGEVQMIDEVVFLSIEDVKSIPNGQKHYLLQDINEFEDIKSRLLNSM